MATAIRFITRTQDTDDWGLLDAVQFVTMEPPGYFTNARTLTGTANQIAIADGGAGGNVTLSTPQDIHTGATPEFAGLGIGGAGVAARVTVPEVRALDGNGLGLFEDSGAGIFVEDGGHVGIGTTNPERLLDIFGGTTDQVTRFRSSDNRASLLISDDDTNIFLIAEDGFVSIGGSSSLAASNLNIQRVTGNVGVGTSAPGAQLHVDQASTTSAKPVIALDQADVDVVLAKIIATAAAASVNRTLVAASDFGTPGALVGWVQIEIQDDGGRIAAGDYYLPFYAAPS